MTPVSVSHELLNLIPGLVLSCIECDVFVQEGSDDLWDTIKNKTEELAANFSVEDISSLPAIAASRKGYRACGKDPARYRLSAEALLRRTLQGKGLYRVNNVVDLLNLVSITYGFSIGGYDADKISGNVVFGIGSSGEPYQGIGRGELNIESLPVFRDEEGAFGTPTSDSLRTSITSFTHRFLMIIISFGASGLLEKATTFAIELLKKHASAKNLDTRIIG
jgi:DNA/RNA-binding domain of Phe-tRNA-synthetase-like protein